MTDTELLEKSGELIDRLFKEVNWAKSCINGTTFALLNEVACEFETRKRKTVIVPPDPEAQCTSTDYLSVDGCLDLGCPRHFAQEVGTL